MPLVFANIWMLKSMSQIERWWGPKYIGGVHVSKAHITYQNQHDYPIVLNIQALALFSWPMPFLLQRERFERLQNAKWLVWTNVEGIKIKWKTKTPFVMGSLALLHLICIKVPTKEQKYIHRLISSEKNVSAHKIFQRGMSYSLNKICIHSNMPEKGKTRLKKIEASWE